MAPGQRLTFQELQELPAEEQDSDQWITLDSVMDGVRYKPQLSEGESLERGERSDKV